MKNITTIWWGSWTFNLVSWLKKIDDAFINAIVTMSDDWWSTGFLRDEYWILPPGDLRRALVALSPDDRLDFLRKLFSYRFKWWLLDWHNLWNLIMLAAEDIEWDYLKALDSIEELLGITKWKVYPVTLEKTRLICKLQTNRYIIWETNIDIPKHPWEEKIDKLHVIKEEYAFMLKEALKFDKQEIFDLILTEALNKKPLHNKSIEKVIKKSDYIIFWPGDLYTSILPNILVWNMIDLLKNSKAKKIYVWNLFTKYWETNWFKLSDFIKVFEKYLWKDFFDYIIVQDWDKTNIPEEILEKYKSEKKEIVETDIENEKIIKADLISSNDIIRHSKDKLAKVISKIL